MYCAACGKPLHPGAKFCSQCGRPQVAALNDPTRLQGAIDPLAPTDQLTPYPPSPPPLPRPGLAQIRRSVQGWISVRAAGLSGASAGPKSELRAALLEFFIPGAGLMYVGKVWKGFFAFVATVFATFISIGIYDAAVRTAVTQLSAACSAAQVAAGACGLPNYSAANTCLAILWLVFSAWTAARIASAIRTLRAQRAIPAPRPYAGQPARTP